MYTVTGRAKELKDIAPTVQTEAQALSRGPIAQSLDLCRTDGKPTAAAAGPSYSVPMPAK